MSISARRDGAHGPEPGPGVPVRAHQHHGVLLHRQEKTSYATGLINLARNIGGSCGIALSTTLIARREQFHQQRLIEHLSPLDASYQSTLEAAKQMFLARGADAAHAAQQAQQFVYDMVQRQASMLAFLEDFRLLAIAFLALIPLMFLMKKTGAGRGSTSSLAH